MAWVCSRSLEGIAGSSPAGGMDVYLLWALCAVRKRSLRLAYHSSTGVLPNVVCLTDCHGEASAMRRPCPTRGCRAKKKKNKETLRSTLFYSTLRNPKVIQGLFYYICTTLMHTIPDSDLGSSSMLCWRLTTTQVQRNSAHHQFH